MKILRLIPLMFLTACSTTPKLALRPQQPPSSLAADTVRFPEVVRAYYVGRYSDPNDGLVMHEQHVLYRVEESTRWDLRPAHTGGDLFFPTAPPHNVAFSPTPVNEAVLAEVNAQRLATIQIMAEARNLSVQLVRVQAALQQARTNLAEAAVLRVAVVQMKKRLDALETTPVPPVSLPNSLTNEPADSLIR